MDTRFERFISVHSFTSSIKVTKELETEKSKVIHPIMHALPFFLTETDLATGKEEEKVLYNFNTELFEILQRV